jgi:hypothetical protein
MEDFFLNMKAITKNSFLYLWMKFVSHCILWLVWSIITCYIWNVWLFPNKSRHGIHFCFGGRQSANYFFSLNERIVIIMMFSRRDLQHNLGPETWGWRTIILFKVLYLDNWECCVVWQRCLHKDPISYLIHNHLHRSSFNLLRPAADWWHTEVMISA